MAVDDVYLAVVALQDDEVAEQAAAGDWSGLGDLELTDEERTLVEDLIEEYAGEVTGFAGGATFAAMNYTSGNVTPSLVDQIGSLGLNASGSGCRRGCLRGCRRMCRRGCRRSAE